MGYNKPSSTIPEKKIVTMIPPSGRFFSYHMVKENQSEICLSVGREYDADQESQNTCLIIWLLELSLVRKVPALFRMPFRSWQFSSGA